jgi:hypothetical protein
MKLKEGKQTNGLHESIRCNLYYPGPRYRWSLPYLINIKVNIMYTIVKQQDNKNRYEAKSFKYSEDMHKFLNKQYDNLWKIIDISLKRGVYFQQYDSETRSFKYINIKALSI